MGAIKSRLEPGVVLVSLAVLQSLWFAVAPGPTLNRLAGVLLGVLAVAASRSLKRSPNLNSVQVAIAALALLNIAVNLWQRNGPIAFRLLLLLAVVGYVAVGVASALVRLAAMSFAGALRVTMALAIPILLVETIAGQPEFPVVVTAERPVTPQPTGDTYAPNSTATSQYPENPRGYFSANTDPGSWALVAQDTSSVGELLRPDEDPSLVQVRIDRLRGSVPWALKLEQRGMALRQGVDYRLTFKARARSPRQMEYAIWSNVVGGANVGLAVRSFRVDTVWRGWSQSFTSTVSDSAATLLFHIGQDTADVELDAVQLVEESTGISASEGGKGGFAVSFRFDSLGCRGPDYPLARAPGTVRILSLGDSYALGAGVHERDTYAARLARLLNQNRAENAGGVHYEVVNCGIAGYGIAEAQQLYLTLGRRLHPDIVLLSIRPGDHQPGDENTGGIRPSAWPIEYLLSSLARWRAWRAAEAVSPQSIDRIIEGARSLGDSVRQDSARLAVVVFDDGTTKSGRELAQAAMSRLRSAGVTVTSLGEQLQIIARRDRVVQEHLDWNPNDVAHGVAASQLYRVLQGEGLLASAEEAAGLRVTRSAPATPASRGRSGRANGR